MIDSLTLPWFWGRWSSHCPRNSLHGCWSMSFVVTCGCRIIHERGKHLGNVYPINWRTIPLSIAWRRTRQRGHGYSSCSRIWNNRSNRRHSDICVHMCICGWWWLTDCWWLAVLVHCERSWYTDLGFRSRNQNEKPWIFGGEVKRARKKNIKKKESKTYGSTSCRLWLSGKETSKLWCPHSFTHPHTYVQSS